MLERIEVGHGAGWIRQAIRWILVAIGAVLIVGGLQFLPDRAASEETAAGSPATLEHIEGSELTRVRLTESAAKRLDIQTGPVRRAPAAGGEGATAIPYAAIIYDAEGETWVYTEAEPLVFVRAPIEVAQIEGSEAVLSDGPPPGTSVVNVGAAELYGTEFEVGH
jgi:hypothetical protein